jgi:para-nitrobenzyl esterase
MRILRFSIVFLALSFLMLTTRAAGPMGPVVKIASGQVRGITSGDLMVFKGIPYAAPPVGNLRWRPPQPVKPWKGVRDATYFGHDCMQLPFPHDAAPLRTKPSEDCLYLNVWAPSNHGSSLLPVMVWIYGGGFVNGGTSPAPYDGSHFAHKGVVFVSFNYRLGRFGFFGFPALLKEPGPHGNYAFMDQIAALKWVQKNIEAFGGNPNEVTIFGESAGGMSVNTLLNSPEARGLFVRAMIESGGGRDNLLSGEMLDHPGANGQPSAVQKGINFARSMGINGTGAAALAALRRLPAEKIVNGINMASMAKQRDTYAGPMIDGAIVTRSAEQSYKVCGQAKAPVVVGANTADLGFSTAKTIQAMFAPFGANAAKAEAAFGVKPGDSVAEAGRALGGAMDMIEPARFVAQRISACGEPAYEYRFSYVAAPLRAKMPGAPHSSEIPYAFDTIRESTWGNMGKGLTPEGLRIAYQMNEYWVNFAKTGDPNGPGLPHWPKFTTAGDKLMNFTLNGPKGEVDPWAERLNLVESIQK